MTDPAIEAVQPEIEGTATSVVPADYGKAASCVHSGGSLSTRLRGFVSLLDGSMPEQTVVHLDRDTLKDTLARLEAAKRKYGGPHDLPSLDGLRAMILATLWAGLRREEGRMLSFALAYVKKDESEIVFPSEVELEDIAQLAPALVRRRSRLGVNTDLRVWGITQTRDRCVKVRALAPGRVAVKYGPENIAILESPQLHLGGNLEKCLVVLADSLPESKEKQLGRTVFAAVALMLIDAVRRHGNGGTVLIVPSSGNQWRQHLEPGRLRLAEESRRYCGLKRAFERLVQDATRKNKNIDFEAVLSVEDISAFLDGQRIQEELWRVVSTVAQLSAIDGALVLDCDFGLVDFGARIKAEGTERYLEREILGTPTEKDISELGGTRHRSAANFVGVCQGSTSAFVASHDGPLSFMEWKEGAVLVTRNVERLID